ncbi:MAG: D-alanine--D-alanine ligase [Gloeomargaritaceae cyanobacterium C42_A2020_066]|nr:D-alanine--D-alanine ligase [Gloeomargaritaceae cyanobacterium C42_A2020_066]
MTEKLRVAVLFGGRSAEHEVSLQSARNIIEALNPERYTVLPIGISPTGQWFLSDGSHLGLPAGRVQALPATTGGELVPTGLAGNALQTLSQVDVVFPVLHGPYGEDGTVQGLLRLADLPFVGSGVLGSAVGMDKDVMKRLLREAGLPVGAFRCCTRAGRPALNLEAMVGELGLPLFVKPANLGSSVGISKVHTLAELAPALDLAFAYDHKVLLESAIIGREIECAVLGNDPYQASIPGEIVPQHEFYSYAAKYLDEKGARLEIPAQLDPATAGRIQDLAIQTCRVLDCEGLGRVDFFLTPEGQIYINEINTIPGFTRISMYPKLWEASGISHPDLVDRLIQLALERAGRDRALRSSC